MNSNPSDGQASGLTITLTSKMVRGGIALLIILALAAMVTGALASPANAPAPAPALAPAAGSSTGTINFQGELTDTLGAPATDGSYDMRFAIYDAPTGGLKKWPSASAYESQSVTVSGGAFNVQLGAVTAIDPSVFSDGGDRWLNIWVCATGTGCTTFDDLGRLPVSSTAYAQSLVAGSTIDGGSGTALYLSGAAASGSVLSVQASATTGNAAAIYGTSSASGGAGISGFNSAGGYGVYGNGYYGIKGESSDATGYGVWGNASATSGLNYGVLGNSNSTQGIGVSGNAGATSGVTYGVWGTSNSTAGYGVYGQNASTQGIGVYGNGYYGIKGESSEPTGYGVWGNASATSGLNYGVFGNSNSTQGIGVSGNAGATSGVTYGVWGTSNSTAGVGVYGEVYATSGINYGVYGKSNSTSAGIGVYGQGVAGGTGVYGTGFYGIKGESSDATGKGVYGNATSTTGSNFGVFGRTESTSGIGVEGWAYATTGVNYGVRGGTQSPSGYAGYFVGNVHITGTLSKSAGTFKIDHPLDPANMYLSHSFVESPDMKNIYDGVIALDENGAAWVEMPDYFQALNQDFRYQLTPIGAAMPNLYIAQEISDNRFQIAGGAPGMKVSWQVTGVRHDPYAEDHPIQVEEQKPPEEQGTYLYPQGYGQPEEMGLDYQIQQSTGH